jgi:hypothetical protein
MDSKDATGRQSLIILTRTGKAVLVHTTNVQDEHKVFPWLQTFITRKLRGIQTCNCNITINRWHKILETNLSNGKKNMFVFHVVLLLINVCNQGKTLCSSSISGGGGRGRIPPPILNLRTRWRWEVSLALRPLYRGWRRLRFLSDSVRGRHSRSDALQKSLLRLSGLKSGSHSPQPICRTDYTIPATKTDFLTKMFLSMLFNDATSC